MIKQKQTVSYKKIDINKLHNYTLKTMLHNNT